MFKGWVPSASGYLSFSYIGGESIPGRTIKEQVKKYPKPEEGLPLSSVCLLQIRNLSDRPKIGNFHFRGHLGQHVFLLVAFVKTESNDNGRCKKSLQGTVISCPEERLSRATYLENIYKGFLPDTLLDKINNYVQDEWKNNTNDFFAVKFSLSDDGVIDLNLITPIDKSMDYDFVFESYSFVKDLLHKHKFHSALDDAVLKPVDIDALESDMDNCHWADVVIRDLHRSVVSSFRDHSSGSAVDALGRLSYLEAFQEVVARRKNNKEMESASISCSTLRLAIKSNLEKSKSQDEGHETHRAMFIGAIGFVVTLLFTCLQLLQMPCIAGVSTSDSCHGYTLNPPLVFLSAARMAINNIHWIFLFFVMAAFVGVLFLYRSTSKVTLSSSMSKDGVRAELIDLFLRHFIQNGKAALSIVIGLTLVTIIVASLIVIRLMSNPSWLLLDVQVKQWLNSLQLLF